MKEQGYETKAQAATRKVGAFARVSDAILVVVFSYLAITSFSSSPGWAVFWGACALFCVFTVITNPLEKIPAFISRVMGVRKG